MKERKNRIRNNKRLKLLDKWVGNLAILAIYLWEGITSGKRDDNGKQNILLVKLAAIGDTVLLIPAIRALRRKFPKASLCMVASKINYGIIKNCPYIDEIIVFDPQRCLKNPSYLFSFARSLKEKGFGFYLDFEQWSRITTLLGYLSGITRRIGFASSDGVRSLLYTDKLPENPNQHEVMRFLELAGLITGGGGDAKLQLWVSESAKKKIKSLFEQFEPGKETGSIVIIHPGCGGNDHPRNWDKAKYVKLCDYLTDKYNVIITGGTSELQLADWIAGKMKGKAVVLAGKTSLDELIEVVRLSDLLVCGNTGVMHIASAVGTSTIALHGPTNPAKWGPWGENNIVVRKDMPCSPCLSLGFEYACRDFECMRLIEVEDVQEAVEKLLK